MDGRGRAEATTLITEALSYRDGHAYMCIISRKHAPVLTQIRRKLGGATAFKLRAIATHRIPVRWLLFSSNAEKTHVQLDYMKHENTSLLANLPSQRNVYCADTEQDRLSNAVAFCLFGIAGEIKYVPILGQTTHRPSTPSCFAADEP